MDARPGRPGVLRRFTLVGRPAGSTGVCRVRSRGCRRVQRAAEALRGQGFARYCTTRAPSPGDRPSHASSPPEAPSSASRSRRGCTTKHDADTRKPVERHRVAGQAALASPHTQSTRAYEDEHADCCTDAKALSSAPLPLDPEGLAIWGPIAALIGIHAHSGLDSSSCWQAGMPARRSRDSASPAAPA
jgi:hypothetical protein